MLGTKYRANSSLSSSSSAFRRPSRRRLTIEPLETRRLLSSAPSTIDQAASTTPIVGPIEPAWLAADAAVTPSATVSTASATPIVGPIAPPWLTDAALTPAVTASAASATPIAGPIVPAVVAEDALTPSAPVSVSGTYLFYDNSKFNKFVEGVGPSDDKAIDTNKTAYVAGAATATFANVSAFTNGINGVMVDLTAGGVHNAITASDFTLRVGLNNSLSTWAAAPIPSTVSVRTGAGTSGSDRVELTWTDGSIKQEALEVTVLADANTGLTSPYTFFYGSVMANSGTGDTGALAITSSTDENAARNHSGTATVTNVFDYNKDGFVNSSDENAARQNGATIKFLHISSIPFLLTGDAAAQGYVTTNTPTVSWTPSPGATSYELIISTNANGTGVVQDFQGLTTTTQTLNTIPKDTTYYEFVYSVGNGYIHALNNGLSFSVAVPEAKVTDSTFLSTIAGHISSATSLNVPIIPVNGATNYAYKIIAGNDAAGSNPTGYSSMTPMSVPLVADFSSLPDGTVTLCLLAETVSGSNVNAAPTSDYTYYTWVKQTGGEPVAPGAFYIFVINPGSPTPTISWGAAAGATSYTLSISLHTNCTSPVQSFPGLTGTSKTINPIAPNTTYYACVTAKDSYNLTTTAVNNALSFVWQVSHRIFVTSSTFNVVTSNQFPPGPGEFGGLTAADYQCTFAAYDANLIPNWNGTDILYKAVLSDGTTSAVNRITINGPIYNMANQEVAANAAQFWSGSLMCAVGYDENGVPVASGAPVWTGSNPDGTTTAAACNGWLNPNLVGGATIGNGTAADSTWLTSGSADCNSSLQLYGISQ